MADKTKFKGGEANQFKVGSFTRDTSLASGNQVVGGIGFKPTSVLFLMVQASVVGEMSAGMDDGVTARGVNDYHASVADWWSWISNNSIYDNEGGAKLYRGYVSSWDTDGFTIAWTRGGLPSGTIIVMYLAMR